MAERDQPVRVKDGIWTLLVEPGLKEHLVRVNQFTALLAGCLGYRDKFERFRQLPRQQYTALLEELPKSSYPVSLIVFMPLDAFFGHRPILLVDVAAREDMR